MYKAQHPESPAGRSKAYGSFLGVVPGRKSEIPLLLARPANQDAREFFRGCFLVGIWGPNSGLGYFVIFVTFKFLPCRTVGSRGAA